MRDLLHMYNDENLSKLFKYFRSNKFGNGMIIDPNGEIGDGMPMKPTGKYDENGRELYETPDG